VSATHVRRGASGRAGSRKGGSRVAVPKKLASKLPVKEAQANRIAGWAFGLFVVAIAGVALIALDVPAKVGIAAGESPSRRAAAWRWSSGRRPAHRPAAGPSA
jgi:cell division protein FtsQ